MAFNDNKPRTHTYANAGNALKLKGVSRLYPCDYQPAFDAVVAAGGATVTVTPVAGNTVAGLKHFNVVIYDGLGNEAAAALNLASPTVAFVADTSGLDTAESWILQFSAAKQGNSDPVACREDFQIAISTGQIAAGATIKARLEPYTFAAANVLRAITNVRVNGGTPVVPAGDTIAQLQAAVEAALDAASIVYETVTVADGTVGTFTITVMGILDRNVLIEVEDGNPAYVPLVLQ